MAIRDNIPNSGAVDPFELSVMLIGGNTTYKSYYAIDVRQFTRYSGTVYPSNTSPTLYIYGTTKIPSNSDITVTDSSATVNCQDSHDVKTIKATSAQEISTGISLDIDLSDYDYLLFVKNTNGGAQAFGIKGIFS